MKFSVLLPTFNSERYVGNAIDSVLEQTTTDAVELIVVDDGSTDSTVQVVRAYGDTIQLHEQPNAGTAAARNRALREATGDVVVLLDHDDELHATFLSEIGRIVAVNSGIGAVFTDQYCFDERRGVFLSFTSFQLWPPPRSLDLLALLRSNYVLPRAAIRRDVLIEAGGFDEDVSGTDDYALWLRVLARGHRIVALPKPLAFYRIRPGSLGSDRLAVAERAQRTLRRALDELPLDLAQRLRCELSIAAWRETAHLAEGARAVEQGQLRRAAGSFRAAWRSSPLQWRSLRIAYFIVQGIARRSATGARGTTVAARGGAVEMRKLPVPPSRRVPRHLALVRRAWALVQFG